MKRYFRILAMLAAIGIGAGSGSVSGFDNWQKSPWIDEEYYFEKSAHKLGFGVLNGLTGWSALFFEPARSGILRGTGKGIWRTLVYTAGGALHAATFPIPLDIPLPEGGVSFEV